MRLKYKFQKQLLTLKAQKHFWHQTPGINMRAMYLIFQSLLFPKTTQLTKNCIG